MKHLENPNALPRAFVAGDFVVVSGIAGDIIGEVLEAANPDEMPELGPGSCSKEALDLMREMHVDLMLLIGHRYNDRPACFWAVRNPDGWVDLRGQRLTIRKGHRCATSA